MDTAPTYKKYSFNLYPTDIDALRDIVAQWPSIVNVTQALRAAIATEHYIREAARNGSHIYIEDADGRMKEIIFK
jgi:tRNA U34 5-methylaminomethyl-2-thiouridine-forming methyltransferase MnmC